MNFESLILRLIETKGGIPFTFLSPLLLPCLKSRSVCGYTVKLSTQLVGPRIQVEGYDDVTEYHGAFKNTTDWSDKTI